jgi:hypothetical protein
MLAAATLAACIAAGSALAAGRPEPKRMTLRLTDLPPHLVVVRKETGRYDVARAASTDGVPVTVFKTHGYVGGYELDVTRRGGLSGDLSSGPFQVISAASLWRSAAGARWSLARSVSSSQARNFRALPTGGRIGGESHLYSYTLQEGDHTFRVYSLGWRDGRVRATVLISGLPTAVTARTAVRLARKQERLIAAETSS